MKRTLHDIITLHLADMDGRWEYGYNLSKKSTKFGWIGNSGERRARELAELGMHKIGAKEYTIERKTEGKYVLYRIPSVKDTSPVYKVEVVNGRPIAVLQHG